MVGLWPNLRGTLELFEFAEARAVAPVTLTVGLCTRLLPHTRSALRGLGWKLDDVALDLICVTVGKCCEAANILQMNALFSVQFQKIVLTKLLRRS